MSNKNISHVIADTIVRFDKDFAYEDAFELATQIGDAIKIDVDKDADTLCPVEPEVSDDFGDLKKMPNVKVKIEGDAGGYWLYGVDWMHHKYLVDRKCGLE